MVPPLPDPSHVSRIIRDVASREILPRFRNLGSGQVAQKSHARDLVTIADTEAERCLTELLRPLASGSAVVGEEGAAADCAILARLGEDAPVWLLDPVDGTMNYVSGTACFAVIVAYCAGGETLAGWIHDPIADSMVWAAAWFWWYRDRPEDHPSITKDELDWIRQDATPPAPLKRAPTP